MKSNLALKLEDREVVQLKLAEDSILGREGQVIEFPVRRGGRIQLATGEIVTMALQPQDVHDPTELPTYLAGYMPFEFRADEVSPVILTDNDQDKYRNFASDDAFRRVDVKASLTGAIPEVDPASALNTYKVVERLIGSFIPRATELQTGNNYRPRQVAARKCKRVIQLDRECDVFSLMTTTGNWTAGNIVALTSGYQWGNLTSSGYGNNSDPVFDIQYLYNVSAQPISHFWLNFKTACALLRHPNVRNMMRQQLGDGAADAAIQKIAEHDYSRGNLDFSIPGLGRFMISAAKVKNESTLALDYIMPDGYVIGVTRPPGVPTDGEEIATTYTFRRRGPSGVGFETREFFVDARGALGGTMVVASMADIAVVTGSNCGGIITGALA